MKAFREDALAYLQHNHPGDAEFHQAVQEIWDDIAQDYDEVAEYAEASVIERLTEPDRIIRFRVTWEDDDGRVHVNRGWRVQFHNLLGAYKGGLRFHPTVNESVLKFLGFEQCFKNALTGLPMGGAKGGSDFDPKGRSRREIMRFCQAFMRELHRHIGPQTDVPAGDINVGSEEIGYLFGEYLRLENRWEGVLTGKSPNFGGSCGRAEATGFGVIYFLKHMLEAHDQSLSGQKLLISGSGNVALHAAMKALEEHAEVLTLSDSSGTLFFENGLTADQLEELMEAKLKHKKRLSELEMGEYLDGKTPWQIEGADIALPCATQNEVSDKDAETLIKNGVKVICEGANMPLTDEARQAVTQANLVYGPAKAANAGGVAVSGLERSQNAELSSWSLERVDDELRRIMDTIHSRCIMHVDKQDGIYPYSRGANLYAFYRLAGAMLAQGIG